MISIVRYVHTMKNVAEVKKRMSERKERLERDRDTLIEIRQMLIAEDDWEKYSPIIEAVTTGGMAIQRIIREDFGDEKSNRDI